MKIAEIISVLEELAPVSLQESYDNSGLICGDRENECSGVLISLDCIEATVDEAIRKNCNMVVSHHPLVFSGMKTFTGKSYVERTLIKAIKNDIALYAIHTNLDNVMVGVNKELGDRIGLSDLKILQPIPGRIRRLITFCPESHSDDVRDAMFEAGGGTIGNYDECSFNTMGTGTFRPKEGADPYAGEIGKQQFEKEVKIEIIYPDYIESRIVKALKDTHPYEVVAYDILKLENANDYTGAGMIGELEEEMDEVVFLNDIKQKLGLQVIRHTELTGRKIKRVAICGGSGSFLLKKAISAGADVFVTGDFKYHQFFDAEGKIVIADIGHFESERFTVNLLERVISNKFRKFAVLISDNLNNPVKYLI